MSFDQPTPTSQRLWLGDVGQNRVEEIDIVLSGRNYGWNVVEGSECFNPRPGCDPSPFEPPVFEYSQANGDRSVTGGYVYRGTLVPALQGKYIYGDFISGRVWALTFDENSQSATNNQLLVDTDNFNLAGFGIDANGEVYLLSLQTGTISRFVLTATDE